MKVKHLPYSDTNSFSDLTLKYLQKDSSLKDSYGRWPSIENFEAQIREKNTQHVNRSALVEVLREQYENVPTSSLVRDNIELLALENTYTIATGHQLCMFTGPLYFLYKIFSAINLAEELRLKYPKSNFVPVFWLATEDHDFDEISQVNIFGKKWIWEQNQKGAVGDVPTEGIKPLIAELEDVLGNSKQAKELITLFKESYLLNHNLASACIYLVNALFSKYGLVVLDANVKKLKTKFKEIIKADLIDRKHKTLIDNRSAKLPKAQAYAREINFFYMVEGLRERIVYDHGIYSVLNTSISFSEQELLEQIEKYPERFSPNVLMRPLYKESILPNLATIGGGAELNYWMQLKDVFSLHSLVFPILSLRNSLLMVDDKLSRKIKDLGFSVSDFFKTEQELHLDYIQKNQTEEISLESEINSVEAVFDEIINKTEDPGLISSVQAEKKKQINSLRKLEQKLRKHEKQKYSLALNKISNIKSKLFPKNALQERFDNFIPYYLNYGQGLMDSLKNNIAPLNNNFTILIED